MTPNVSKYKPPSHLLSDMFSDCVCFMPNSVPNVNVPLKRLLIKSDFDQQNQFFLTSLHTINTAGQAITHAFPCVLCHLALPDYKAFCLIHSVKWE